METMTQRSYFTDFYNQQKHLLRLDLVLYLLLELCH